MIFPLFFFFRACRVLQGWQIEKRFPASRRKKTFQSKLQIRELPCLCLQPFYDRKLCSYPKIFDLRGENSTRSSWVSCPGSFQWTDQSKNRAGAEARAIKLSQHSWRYTVTGTDFLCEAVFSPHTGRFCALEKCFASCYFFFCPTFELLLQPQIPQSIWSCVIYTEIQELSMIQQHVEFEGSAQTVDIYNPSSSREPWRMILKPS